MNEELTLTGFPSYSLWICGGVRDMDGLIHYLASQEASRYVTGATFTIDGGMSW